MLKIFFLYSLSARSIFKCIDIFDLAKLYSPDILSVDSPLENLLVISYFLLFDSLKTF